MPIYDRGGGELPAGIEGLPCWIAVDMSTTTDLTAVIACVRKVDDFVLVPHFFCPGDNPRARADRDGVPYCKAVDWFKCERARIVRVVKIPFRKIHKLRLRHARGESLGTGCIADWLFLAAA
jgi:phage terminase large subunit-like protein